MGNGPQPVPGPSTGRWDLPQAWGQVGQVTLPEGNGRDLVTPGAGHHGSQPSARSLEGSDHVTLAGREPGRVRTRPPEPSMRSSDPSGGPCLLSEPTGHVEPRGPLPAEGTPHCCFTGLWAGDI